MFLFSQCSQRPEESEVMLTHSPKFMLLAGFCDYFKRCVLCPFAWGHRHSRDKNRSHSPTATLGRRCGTEKINWEVSGTLGNWVEVTNTWTNTWRFFFSERDENELEGLKQFVVCPRLPGQALPATPAGMMGTSGRLLAKILPRDSPGALSSINLVAG